MKRSVSRGDVRAILVVDDEALLRALVVDALRDAGFEVLEAGDAADALQRLRGNANGIDGLFTDVHMPGEMDGVALAHEVRRCWPWIDLLIASGQLRPRQEDLPSGSRFLPKPYELHDVVRNFHDMGRSIIR